jgi:predicted acylesterase/phospholipase RssA
LLRENIPPLVTPKVNDVGLRLVVGAISGHGSFIGSAPATTYEGVLPFTSESFDTEAGRAAIYNAAVASAAFPIVFAPVEVPGFGPCYDGGVVNDAPVALASESGAERVIVIAPYPMVSAPARVPTGIDLVMHLVDVLIHERLYRDLKAATNTNDVVARLTALVDKKLLSQEQLAQVLKVLDARQIEIVQIRPDEELAGDPFAGFLHKDLRAQYIAAGRQAAERALANLLP